MPRIAVRTGTLLGNKKAPRRELFTEEEGLEPPSLTAAVFKTADLPISLFLQLVRKE